MIPFIEKGNIIMGDNANHNAKDDKIKNFNGNVAQTQQTVVMRIQYNTCLGKDECRNSNKDCKEDLVTIAASQHYIPSTMPT